MTLDNVDLTTNQMCLQNILELQNLLVILFLAVSQGSQGVILPEYLHLPSAFSPLIVLDKTKQNLRLNLAEVNMDGYTKMTMMLSY